MNIRNQIESLETWINARTHRERLMVLALSCAVIYFVWYLLLDRPLSKRLAVLKMQIANIVPQIKIFDDQAKKILAESHLNASQKNLEAKQLATLKLASPQDLDNLMTAILSPNQNIKITGLKSIAPDEKPALAPINKKIMAASTPVVEDTTPQKHVDKSSMQLEFQSDYFDTIAYLKQLENLPWCLSWDSLEYNVVNYPNATVIIKLHIVKAA
ncbi:MAG: type II secretion system protein GspM [Gammaproteobacteria bacterium]|nr:type II secretion system protein GspM [Gammaproteobacteria bacterium]